MFTRSVLAMKPSTALRAFSSHLPRRMASAIVPAFSAEVGPEIGYFAAEPVKLGKEGFSELLQVRLAKLFRDEREAPGPAIVNSAMREKLSSSSLRSGRRGFSTLAEKVDLTVGESLARLQRATPVFTGVTPKNIHFKTVRMERPDFNLFLNVLLDPSICITSHWMQSLFDYKIVDIIVESLNFDDKSFRKFCLEEGPFKEEEEVVAFEALRSFLKNPSRYSYLEKSISNAILKAFKENHREEKMRQKFYHDINTNNERGYYAILVLNEENKYVLAGGCGLIPIDAISPYVNLGKTELSQCAEACVHIFSRYQNMKLGKCILVDIFKYAFRYTGIKYLQGEVLPQQVQTLSIIDHLGMSEVPVGTQCKRVFGMTREIYNLKEGLAKKFYKEEFFRKAPPAAELAI